MYLGALPAAQVTWGLALLFCVWALVNLLALQLTGGLATSTYDAMVRARFHAPAADPRVLIVDIDEASLASMAKEFGRWPWPRDTLATVLDYVEKQQPAAIAWDIVFSDADRLSPGGDKAFDEAAKRSAHSHFSVVRLPAVYDAQSQVTQAVLPRLWVAGDPVSAKAATVAMIAPVLPAVAAAQLGYNNGYPDADGVLRRYRFAENLADGSRIRSMALAVAQSIDTDCAIKKVAACAHSALVLASFASQNQDRLMVWRAKGDSYPRVSFADVFAAAEGGKPPQPLPSLAGKILLIGATASSLHDVHPTPLSPLHAGVDTLATAIDNAVNGHQLAELPRWLQAVLAITLTLGMAAWVQRRGISSLDAALLLLPGALLGISYLSLNTPGWLQNAVFLDLHLAAGIALLYIALLRMWNGWRRSYWCDPLSPNTIEPVAIACRAPVPVADAGLDFLISQLERHAPHCRLVGGDATATWPAKLRWPELQQACAVMGPLAQIQTLVVLLAQQSIPCTEPVALTDTSNRSDIAHTARRLCANL